MPVSLTEAAARHVTRYLSKRGKGVGVRLGVKTTGCSGLAYKLEYVDEVAPEDIVFEDHGVIMRTLGCGIPNDAKQVMDALAEGGIDLADVNRTLENEGIDKFTKSFDNLLQLIGDTRKTYARAVLESLPGSLV